jgi:hypothetical protein
VNGALKEVIGRAVLTHVEKTFWYFEASLAMEKQRFR